MRILEDNPPATDEFYKLMRMFKAQHIPFSTHIYCSRNGINYQEIRCQFNGEHYKVRRNSKERLNIVRDDWTFKDYYAPQAFFIITGSSYYIDILK